MAAELPPPPPLPRLRVLYAVPADREVSESTAADIRDAIQHFRGWLREQTGGLTFSVRGELPQVCIMLRPHDQYATGNGLEKVMAAVQHCAPVSYDPIPLLPDLPDTPQTFAWVVVADVQEECDPRRELNRAAPGIAMLALDRDALRDTYDCSREPLPWVWGEWVGLSGAGALSLFGGLF